MSTARDQPVVVITGGSAGVGRAAARAFARQGAWVGLIARGQDGLKAACAEIEQAGSRAVGVPADVADAVQVEEAANRIEELLGPVTVWVNNAMVSVFSPVREMGESEYSRVTSVTYLGYVHGTLAALRRMLPRDRGVIVQVSSALAFRSIPLQSAYCGAKHAIKGFTESLRCELLHERSGVKVSMVHLPGLNTPQFRWVKSRLPKLPQPVPPVFQPELAAEAILWAARHAPRDLNVGLSTAIAIRGNQLFPGLADRYLAWTGYRSQQTREFDTRPRPANLWQPVPGDPGAHGDFDRQAHRVGVQLWLATHLRLFR